MYDNSFISKKLPSLFNGSKNTFTEEGRWSILPGVDV
jgi:hypothetical protein